MNYRQLPAGLRGNALEGRTPITHIAETESDAHKVFLDLWAHIGGSGMRDAHAAYKDCKVFYWRGDTSPEGIES